MRNCYEKQSFLYISRASENSLMWLNYDFVAAADNGWFLEFMKFIVAATNTELVAKGAISLTASLGAEL